MRLKCILHLVRAWAGTLFLVFLSSSVMASPLPPPLLCVDDTDCVETGVEAEPPPPGGTYTLANATAGLPFAINTPILPTITSEVMVTPATIAANKVNGRRIILQAGNYGNQQFGTQDQEIVIQPGVEIGTLSFGNTARRLHFRGSPVRAGRIRTVHTGGSFNNDIADLFFDGITADDTGSPSQNQWHGNRIAVINSSITADIYAGGNFHNVTDFIWANSLIHTYGATQANVRSHGALRYVIVDCRFRKSGGLNHALRVHADNVGGRVADNIYIARNQIDGARVAIRGDGQANEGAGPAAARAGIGTVWFEDNTLYNPGPTGNASFFTGFTTPDSERPQMLHLINNVLYTDMGTWHVPGTPRVNWVIEPDPNTHLPYEPPPSWSFA